MAGEIQYVGPGAGRTCYITIRNRIGQIWNNTLLAFETYAVLNYTDYDIASVEQGTASNIYVSTFPSTIVPGVYSIVAYQQLAGSPAETDKSVATGDYQWNGSVTMPLSDVATSGQLGQIGPIRIFRGQMVQNFPLYLKSAADHVTPFTSGVISGQISRDGGVFGVLQSGTVSEVGLGFYKVTLTSGDLLANTASVVFTGLGVSGGLSDPLAFGLVLQRTSGQ